jgi:hypothetical protein
MLWKCGKVKIFGNNSNELKLYSQGNEKYIRLDE